MGFHRWFFFAWSLSAADFILQSGNRKHFKNNNDISKFNVYQCMALHLCFSFSTMCVSEERRRVQLLVDYITHYCDYHLQYKPLDPLLRPYSNHFSKTGLLMYFRVDIWKFHIDKYISYWDFILHGCLQLDFVQ